MRSRRKTALDERLESLGFTREHFDQVRAELSNPAAGLSPLRLNWIPKRGFGLGFFGHSYLDKAGNTSVFSGECWLNDDALYDILTNPQAARDMAQAQLDADEARALQQGMTIKNRAVCVS